MAQSWHGDGELLVFRDNARLPVVLDVYRKPHRPDRPGRWAGSFVLTAFAMLTPGRGVVYLPNGAAAEVMVEGFDVVTGKGDFFGLDPAPF